MPNENRKPSHASYKGSYKRAGGLITDHFPQATFLIEEGFDPEGVYMIAIVDIADTDEVIDVIGDRLVEMQVDESLPLYVTPLRPIERVMTELRNREQVTPPASLPIT